MKIYYLEDVADFLEKLSEQERSRVTRTREYFEKYGFIIGSKYIKKINSKLWELRSGRIRIFLCMGNDKAIGVHVIYKKSQRLPLKDVHLAINRCKEL